MLISLRHLCAGSLLSGLLTLSVACSGLENAGSSNGQDPVNPIALSSTKTVNLPHTSPKWQSIGNCWAYAAAGWIESLMLRTDGQDVLDVSETYITYRHYEQQLAYTFDDELETGGSFQQATRLILTYGLMTEADFAPDEANSTKSDRQKQATNILNESIAFGPLSQSRSKAVVRSELDRAFGVNMKELEEKIVNPSDILVSTGRGQIERLSDVMASWREISWPIDFSSYPDAPQPGAPAKPIRNPEITEQQIALLRRAMRAMNAGHPIVLNWFVDFNGMNQEGVFGLNDLEENGLGRQGYHSTVAEDYVAEGFDPFEGRYFRTPEGEVSDSLKATAARFGIPTAFIIKNSWGGSERLDRASYFRDGEKGYHKLMSDYLFAFIPQLNEETQSFQGFTTGLNGIILPPGF
ncbi:MAG: hypothetical protein RJB13_1449 [Pseudomonadota bacterium]